MTEGGVRLPVSSLPAAGEGRTRASPRDGSTGCASSGVNALAREERRGTDPSAPLVEDIKRKPEGIGKYTNLTGVFHCCHAAIPHLAARGGGWWGVPAPSAPSPRR